MSKPRDYRTTLLPDSCAAKATIGLFNLMDFYDLIALPIALSELATGKNENEKKNALKRWLYFTICVSFLNISSK